jgi:hypothetical protein
VQLLAPGLHITKPFAPEFFLEDARTEGMMPLRVWRLTTLNGFDTVGKSEYTIFPEINVNSGMAKISHRRVWASSI